MELWKITDIFFHKNTYCALISLQSDRLRWQLSDYIDSWKIFLFWISNETLPIRSIYLQDWSTLDMNPPTRRIYQEGWSTYKDDLPGRLIYLKDRSTYNEDLLWSYIYLKGISAGLFVFTIRLVKAIIALEMHQ